jgi:uncharacterized protein (TIGR00251 family)
MAPRGETDPVSRPWHRWQGETLILSVRVQPRAAVDEIVGPRDGRLRVRVTAPPVDDAANRRVVVLLARELGTAKSAVRILAGASAREKRVAVEGPRRHPPWLPRGTDSDRGR